MLWGRLGCWASDEDSTAWAWTDAIGRAPPRMAGSGGHFTETALLLKDAPGSRKRGSQIGAVRSLRLGLGAPGAWPLGFAGRLRARPSSVPRMPLMLISHLGIPDATDIGKQLWQLTRVSLVV